MADTALFVGWGGTHPGRELYARKHFTEWTEMLKQLESEGKIERFETVLLEPNGGEVDGFTFVYGTREQLAAVYGREDLNPLRAARCSTTRSPA